MLVAHRSSAAADIRRERLNVADRRRALGAGLLTRQLEQEADLQHSRTKALGPPEAGVHADCPHLGPAFGNPQKQSRVPTARSRRSGQAVFLVLARPITRWLAGFREFAFVAGAAEQIELSPCAPSELAIARPPSCCQNTGHIQKENSDGGVMTTTQQDSEKKPQSLKRYFVVTLITSIALALVVLLITFSLEQFNLVKGMENGGEDVAMRIYANSERDLTPQVVVVNIDNQTRRMWDDAKSSVGERLPDLVHLVAGGAKAIVLDLELAQGVERSGKDETCQRIRRASRARCGAVSGAASDPWQ